MGLAIEAETLALLNGMNLLVEGDSATIIPWVNTKERGLQKLDSGSAKSLIPP